MPFVLAQIASNRNSVFELVSANTVIHVQMVNGSCRRAMGKLLVNLSRDSPTDVYVIFQMYITTETKSDIKSHQPGLEHCAMV